MNKSRILSAIALCLLVRAARADDLLTIYRQALEEDPRLKSAAAKLEVGAAQKGQALGQMLPQVNASGNWSANQQRIDNGSHATNSTYAGTRYYVSLNQTLVDFAKFWEWRRAAKVEDQYAAEQIEAENELINNVVERYFTVLEAEDQLALARAEKETTRLQLEQVQKQFAKQVLKITDVYAVEARLDLVAADEIKAESQVVIARQGLRELTGVMPLNLSRLKENIEYKPLEGDLQQWIEMAKSQNPILSSKRKAIEAAENNVTVQKSKYLPVVDLQLNYYDTNTGYNSQRLGSDIQNQVAAINVNVPLFSGGTTTQQLFEAKSQLRLSQYDNESALRGLIKETSDAFLSTNADVKSIKAGHKALESAVKSRESMARGLYYGVVTVSDLLKAQEGEFVAKRDLAQAKYSYIKNHIRFLLAIGSLAEDHLREINDWLEAPRADNGQASRDPATGRADSPPGNPPTP
ncbi:TolC family outer membrane protein [Methylomicrobium album]|uniref:Type I secretion outer membrane protein, TolC family n=1 Tax=Methylomicrobium album BG8 TaxID=686340 RepID=H8GFV2_METAL|nr:TolC family outer membrane protein [Methylomicrobium album]EIC28703.1 type I secretion outer membrane protein, TolC family [Methylomicrobium album BG8]